MTLGYNPHQKAYYLHISEDEFKDLTENNKTLNHVTGDKTWDVAKFTVSFTGKKRK